MTAAERKAKFLGDERPKTTGRVTSDLAMSKSAKFITDTGFNQVNDDNTMGKKKIELKSNIFRQDNFQDIQKDTGEKKANMNFGGDWKHHTGNKANVDDGKTANDRKRLTNKSSISIGVEDEGAKQKIWEDHMQSQ